MLVINDLFGFLPTDNQEIKSKGLESHTTPGDANINQRIPANNKLPP